MRFEYPIYLLLILLVPFLVLLFGYVVNWKKKTVNQIGDPDLIQRLIISYSPKRFQIKFILLLFALVLLIFGLANLQQEKNGDAIPRKGIDIIVALDVSNSMLTQDVQPDRLQRSKIFISELMKRRADDRIGLLLFAGHAYLQMPLSRDLTALAMYVQSASPESVPTQGTVLAEALQSAAFAFEKNDKKYKAIVLISDGENHESDAIQAAKELKDQGIVLYTVGVGTSPGQTLIDPITNQPKLSKEGMPVVSKLNEQILQELMQQTGGAYYFLTDVQSIAEKMSTEMNGLGKRDIKDKSLLQYNSFFPWFIFAGILLLVIEFFLSERKQIQ